MGRKDNVVAFRRPVRVRPRPRFPWWRRRRILGQQRLFAILCVAVLVIPFAALQVEDQVEAPFAALQNENQVDNSFADLQVEKSFAERPASHTVSDTRSPRAMISWVDGDSGRINGREFRLYGVDAPEGSPSRARCDRERVRADEARYAVRALTMGKRTVIRRSYGPDRYGRQLVDLSVDGKDVAANLLARGHLKRWDYPREAKPDWCS
ncbi:MAG: thermonuclease family protein [Hyphomonas sp.]